MNGKAFLVTGAGRGLGRAITLEAVAAGATVGALDIDRTLLDQLTGDAASFPAGSFPCTAMSPRGTP